MASRSQWEFGVLAGAGALRSSANDILTFLEAFLGYSESPLATAIKAIPEVRRPVGKTKFEGGLGWSILGDIVWHDGGAGGFRSFIGFHPKARVGVGARRPVVVIPASSIPARTKGGPSTNSIASQVCSLVLGSYSR